MAIWEPNDPTGPLRALNILTSSLGWSAMAIRQRRSAKLPAPLLSDSSRQKRS